MHPDAAEQLDKFNQHVYPSTTEENIKYHIGIIDYLQEYDVSKKMEKYSKKFIKFNTNLDTSS
jgi:1-phosphatidylinositol-4-phosphate 5-kinase